MAGFTFRACAVRGGSILQGLLSIEGMTGIDLPVITLIEKREDAHLLAKCLFAAVAAITATADMLTSAVINAAVAATTAASIYITSCSYCFWCF